MIISFRTTDERNGLINESRFVGSFNLVFKIQSQEVLVTPKWYIDIYNHTAPNTAVLQLSNLRSSLTAKFQLNKDNYRLYYIDDENDQIPIEGQSELEEAVKFASQNCGIKSITLIIGDGKESLKNIRKISPRPFIVIEKTTGNMAPMSIEPTPVRAGAEKKNDDAIEWFKDFLDSYKTEIAAEVMKEVLHKLNSAFQLSGTTDSALFRQSEAESMYAPRIGVLKSQCSRDKINKLYKARAALDLNELLDYDRQNSFRMQTTPSSLPPLSPSPSDYCPALHQLPSIYTQTFTPQGISGYPSVPMPAESSHPTSDPKPSSEDSASQLLVQYDYMNRYVNEKETRSDSDNISFFSNHNDVSDFIMEDAVFSDDGSENYDTRRPASCSSFEFVSEDFEDVTSPEKKVEKPNIYVDVGNSSNGQDKNFFRVDNQRKYYEKHIADTPEENVIATELDQRTGGTYSVIASSLPDGQQDIFCGEGSNKSKFLSDSVHSGKFDELMKEEKEKEEKNVNSEMKELMCEIDFDYFGTQNDSSATNHSSFGILSDSFSTQTATSDTPNDCFINQNDSVGLQDVCSDSRSNCSIGTQNANYDSENGACALLTGEKIVHQYTDSSEDSKTESIPKEKKAGIPRNVKITPTKTGASAKRGKRVVIDYNASKGLGDTMQTAPESRTTKKTKVTNQQQQQRQQQFLNGSTESERQGQSQNRDPCEGPYIFGYRPTLNPEEVWRRQTEEWNNARYRNPQWRYEMSDSDDYSQILREPFISGVYQAAVSAYSTARTVLDKIRNPLLDIQSEPKSDQS